MEELLDFTNAFAADSKMDRLHYETDWCTLQHVVRGVPISTGKKLFSDIRNDYNKQYHMAWSVATQIESALYDAFVRDTQSIGIVATSSAQFSNLVAAIYGVLFDRANANFRSYKAVGRQHRKAILNCIDYGFCLGIFRVGNPVSADRLNYDLSYEVLPPDRLFLDWQVEDFSDMRLIIVEHYLPEPDFKSYAQFYNFVNSEKSHLERMPYSQLREIRNTVRPQSGSYGSPRRYPIAEGVHVIWECYARWGGQVVRYFTTNFAQDLLMEPEVCPGGMPFVNGEIYSGRGTFLGLSLLSVLEAPQETFNEIYNSQLDNDYQMLRPKWLIGTSGAGINPRDLLDHWAERVHFVDNLDSFKMLEYPNVNQQTGASIAKVEGMMRGFAGLPEQLTGTSGTPDETISQVYSVATKKLNLILGSFSDTYWKPWHNKLLDMLAFYSTDAAFADACAAAHAQPFKKDDGGDASLMRMLGGDMLEQMQAKEFISDLRLKYRTSCEVEMAHVSLGNLEGVNMYKMLLESADKVNASILALVANGTLKREDAKIINEATLMKQLMQKAGVKGVGAILTKLALEPPPPPPQQPQQAPPGMGGQIDPAMMQQLQQGEGAQAGGVAMPMAPPPLPGQGMM